MLDSHDEDPSLPNQRNYHITYPKTQQTPSSSGPTRTHVQPCRLAIHSWTRPSLRPPAPPGPAREIAISCLQHSKKDEETAGRSAEKEAIAFVGWRPSQPKNKRFCFCMLCLCFFHLQKNCVKAGAKDSTDPRGNDPMEPKKKDRWFRPFSEYQPSGFWGSMWPSAGQ